MTTSTASGIAPRTVEPGPAVHDFDFYMGTWRVRHRRLTERLAGSDEWEEFEGTSRAWPLLDGAGNIDDNVLELPDGTYRAISLRTYEPWSGPLVDLVARRPDARSPRPAGRRRLQGRHRHLHRAPTPSKAGRSSSASSGRPSPPRPAAGSRPSPSTTARPGRSTGSCSRRGSRSHPEDRFRSDAKTELQDG